MEMTFDQYIQNPMGIANSVMSNREMYRSMYSMKLDAIMVREMGKIDYKLYKGKNSYYAYIKVPSEVVEKFYYDVVIEFRPGKNTKSGDKTLKNYDVRFYSNDPAFVYTFAHAFIKNDLFISRYADKMSKEAVKHVAKEKNPHNTVGYVKSLFFAYLIMIKFGLFNIIKYTDKYDEKRLKSSIMNASEKIALRTELGQEYNSKKKKEAIATKKARKEVSDRRNILPPEVQIKATKSSNKNKIKKTPTIGTIKTVKTVSKIGKKK